MEKLGPLPIHVAQIGCLNKVMCAWNLLQGLRQYDREPCTPERWMELDAMAESYRMMTVNYLTALVGQKKNDKISIFNNPIKGKEQQISDFYSEYANDLANLHRVRDKVYSHFDLDFADAVKELPNDFITNCIEDLVDILGSRTTLRLTKVSP